MEPAAEAEPLAVDGARPWKVTIDWGMDSVTWAGDPFVPAAVRSTFDGRCATPADYVVGGAAAGSALATVYSGTRGFDFETMEYLLYFDYVITGGTRRFDGASGGGPGGARVASTTMLEVFAGEATMPVWIDGTIVYAPGKALGR